MRATGAIWNFRAALLVTAVCGSAAAAEPATRTVDVGFAPPDGTLFDEVVTVRKEQRRKGREPEIERTQGTARYAVRAVDGGYRVQVKAVSVSSAQRSADLQTLMRSLFADAELTYELDARGRLVAVHGADEALLRVRRELVKVAQHEAPELTEAQVTQTIDVLFQAFAASGGPAELAAQGWNQRSVLGFLAGQRVPLDEVRRDAPELALVPGGRPVAGNRTIQATDVACGARRCLSLRVTFRADGDAVGATLAEAMASMFRDVLERAGAGDAAHEIPRIRIAGARAEVEIVRVIDPVTGLPQREADRRTLTGALSIGDDPPTPVTSSQVSDYQYRYR